MGNNSHLYSGFMFTNVLPSVKAQRSLQCDILKDISNTEFSSGKTLLSVGIGYGDELEFFASCGALQGWAQIDCIDLVGEVESIAREKSAIAKLKNRFSFVALDLRNLRKHMHFGKWNLIQCGFILEEIQFEEKDQVYSTLYDALLPGGWLIVSEMFLDNRPSFGESEQHRRREVATLYDEILREARTCLDDGDMSESQFRALCGSCHTPGLVLTRREAIEGLRDYFESVELVRTRLENLGFCKISTRRNSVNSWFGIIIAQKPK